MNKLTSFVVLSLAGSIIMWSIQYAYEQNTPKGVQGDAVSSIISSDSNVRTLLGGDAAGLGLTKGNTEGKVKLGDTFSVTLKEAETGSEWKYEADDAQAFETAEGEILNQYENQQVWGFTAMKEGEHYLYFQKYNSVTNEPIEGQKIDFKITVNR